MKLIDIIRKTQFEKVWDKLAKLYPEVAFQQKKYSELYYILSREHTSETAPKGNIVLKRMPLAEAEVIVMKHGHEFPIETLPNRKIEIVKSNIRYTRRRLSNEEKVAHILYGVSIHGFETTEQYYENLQKYYDNLKSGKLYRIDEELLEPISDDKHGLSLRLIFLDIDGVLNSERNIRKLQMEQLPYRDEYGPLFDPEAVDNLRQIIDNTGAKIVITSSWRYLFGFVELKEIWEKRRLPGKLHGITSMVSFGTRGDEIQEYLQGAIGSCANDYVILDDECDFEGQLLEHYVKVNPQKGITDCNAMEAIDILSRNKREDEETFRKERLERGMKHRLQEKTVAYNQKMRFWTEEMYHDTPWDYTFILRILRRKLIFDIGYYQRYNHHEGGNQIILDMKRCVKMIDIVIDGSIPDEKQRKALSILWKIMGAKMQSWWD